MQYVLFYPSSKPHPNFPSPFCPSLNSAVSLTLDRGKCDATTPYISISSTSTTGNDLSNTTWIEDSKSYMCFADATAARRFVRVARLRVGMEVEGLED